MVYRFLLRDVLGSLKLYNKKNKNRQTTFSDDVSWGDESHLGTRLDRPYVAVGSVEGYQDLMDNLEDIVKPEIHEKCMHASGMTGKQCNTTIPFVKYFFFILLRIQIQVFDFV